MSGSIRVLGTMLAAAPAAAALARRLAIAPLDRGSAETTLARVGVEVGLDVAVWHA